MSQRISKQCHLCGSDDVSVEAFVSWDFEGQTYRVDGLCDKGHTCNECGQECHLVEVKIEAGENTVHTDPAIPASPGIMAAKVTFASKVQVGERIFDQIRVCIGGLHTACDLLSGPSGDLQIRQALALADNLNAMVLIGPELRDRVEACKIKSRQGAPR